MWQLLALGSLFAAAGENIIDKSALVSNKKIDVVIATFWRFTTYLCLISLIGFSGWAGALHIRFIPEVMLLAVIAAASALGYTYLMRHVEVTGMGVISYLAPFVFLGIDTLFLQRAFSASEIAGMILLIMGGASFAIDGKTHRLKKEFSLKVSALLVLSVAFTGILAYALKYVYTAYDMNAVSFFTSYSVLASGGLLVICVLQGKAGALFARPALTYVPRIAASKTFDAVGSLMWAQALVLASVSQVSAIGALQPLVLFVLATITQAIFRINLQEKTEKIRLEWKAAAVCCLVLGSVLIN